MIFSVFQGVEPGRGMLEFSHCSKGRRNNKLNFLWPKIAPFETAFLTPNCPQNVYVGPLFAFFPRMRPDNFFFWGPKWGFLGNGRNTLSRALFRKRELTEFCGNLSEFCNKTQ